MTFFAAAAWSLGARLGLDTLVLALSSLQPRARLDAVTLVLCQSAAFLAALVVLLRVHERQRPLADCMALRPTVLSLCLLAAVLGVVLHAPFDGLADLIALHFPPSAEQIAAQAEAFRAPDLLHRSTLLVAAGVAAPVVEEMFFRGALFRGLRRGHTASLTIVATALLFASSHLSMRIFVPVFAVGLVLSHARAASGSLWPALILHVAFNTFGVLDGLRISADVHGAAARPSLTTSLCGFLVSLGLLFAYDAIARRNGRCASARERDLS
jgi:uncharacterized protein